jgi:hypothetical protein
VTADAKFNPAGDWKGYAYEYTSDYWFNATFSGDYASGTVSAEIYTAPGTGTGTYSISGNTINFVLHFVPYDLEFTGTITDDNNMKGNWQTSGSSGTWTLTRQ